MKLGYPQAVALLLVASSWALGQGPAPLEYAPPAGAGVAPGAGFGPYEDPMVHPRVYDPVYGRQPYTVWGSAEALVARIRNGTVPQVNFMPPVGVLTVTTFDRNFLVGNDGLVTEIAPTNFIDNFFPLRIENVPVLPDTGEAGIGDHCGFRTTVGAWISPDRCCGIEGSFFLLGRRSYTTSNSITDADNQILFTTPFFINEFTITPAAPGNIATPPAPPTREQTGQEAVFFIRQLNSQVVANIGNSMYGAEVNLRTTCGYFGPLAIGFLAGPRYLNFEEDLTYLGTFSLFRPQTVTPQGGFNGDPPGITLADRIDVRTLDSIRARNQFYGGQVGADGEWSLGCFFVGLRAKVAMGVMHQSLDVFGVTQTTSSPVFGPDQSILQPASSNTTSGGLLSTGVNVGRYGRNRVSFIPEVNLKVGAQICSWMRIYAGYDAMYVCNALRPGDATSVSPVNTTLQANNAPTPAGSSTTNEPGIANSVINQPSIILRNSNVWTEGFNFGMEFSY